MYNMAVEWMTWDSVSILNEINGLFHLKRPITEIMSVWHGGISFLQNSQGKTVSRPTVYLAFWSFCLSRNVSVGWQVRWLSTASGLYLSLNAIFVLYKKKIHGDRIISDEGISVCFQHVLFGWFLFCLGQSWELRTDAAVSPAMFSLVNVSLYTIFIEMASMEPFPGYLNVGLVVVVFVVWCFFVVVCLFLFPIIYLFIIWGGSTSLSG